MAPGVASHSASLNFLLSPQKLEKAPVVVFGYAPIPARLVAKITRDQLVDLLDKLSVHFWTTNQELETCLDGNSSSLFHPMLTLGLQKKNLLGPSAS